jgi:predicted O-linked N-acetylglucosamine transferase (SPINDLY family)
VYRRVLAADPDNDAALYFLGLIAARKGKFELAIRQISKAIENNPARSGYHLDLGLLLARRGRLDEAATSLEAALALDPEDRDAHNELGDIRLDQGRADDALASFRQAAALDPASRAAQSGLGRALYALGQLDAAVTHFRKLTDRDPADADAHADLALALRANGRVAEAIACCERALSLHPNHAAALNNLGIALQAQGRFDESLDFLENALKQNPQRADIHNNLGVSLSILGRPQQASPCFRRAIDLDPRFIEAYLNLGNSLRAEGRPRDAIKYLTKALAVEPGNLALLNGLGLVFQAQEQLKRARECFEKALALKEDSPLTHNNLGMVAMASGEPEQARTHFARAVEIDPGHLEAHSNLLLCENYVSGITAREIYAHHLRFGERFEAPLRPLWRPHDNAPQLERKLRLGYVSGDFCQHAATHSIEALLENHDRNAFEVFCYSNGARHDAVTDRLIADADHWRSVLGQSDDRVADIIRNDRIDILVDLSGHTAGNRLMVFARKPAPVQVSWIGYVTTTGLRAIDFRISDEYADPSGRTEAFHTERLWRLPSVTVFRPTPDSPPVNPLPALTNKRFTFACLNNLAKVTAEAIALWARILLASPNARLLLGNANDADVRARLLGKFSECGVDPSRLDIQPRLPLSDFLMLHHQIDLALDPFPFNGGATSCHALWMGVPFITLAGDRYMARMGVSLLSSVGLPNFIAPGPDEYALLAAELASNPAPLVTLRGQLRERMTRSLGAADRFARNMERAYRDMWREWCGRQGTNVSLTPRS